MIFGVAKYSLSDHSHLLHLILNQLGNYYGSCRTGELLKSLNIICYSCICSVGMGQLVLGTRSYHWIAMTNTMENRLDILAICPEVHFSSLGKVPWPKASRIDLVVRDLLCRARKLARENARLALYIWYACSEPEIS